MTTPDFGLDHYTQRAKLAKAVALAAAALWRKVDPSNIAESWAEQIAALVAVLTGAQQAAAASAEPFVHAAAIAEGVAGAAAVGEVAAQAFSGFASDGRPLASLLFQPAIASLMAIKSGASQDTALATGLASVQMLVATQVQDAGRAADQVALTVREPMDGYVRVVVGETCSRCIILAGRIYLWSDGFKRHPNCDCIMLPVKDAESAGIDQDPRVVYDSLTPAERTAAGWSRSDQQAIADGADLNQVTNARRSLRYLNIGGRQTQTTMDGITSRGVYGGYVLGEDGILRRRESSQLRKAGGRYRVTVKPRLTPDSIYRIAEDRDDAIRLLRVNGYLFGEAAVARTAASTRSVVRKTPSEQLGGVFAKANAGGSAQPGTQRATEVREVLEKAGSIAKLRLVVRDELYGLGVIDGYTGIDFIGQDLEVAREYAEGIIRCADIFKVRISRVVSYRERGGAYAEVRDGTELAFNSYWASKKMRPEMLANLADAEATRYNTPGANNPLSTAIHEFAHLLDLGTLDGKAHKRVQKFVKDSAVKDAVKPSEHIKNSVSEYATTDTAELIAEAFTDVMMNGESASALSKGIFDILADEYRKHVND